MSPWTFFAEHRAEILSATLDHLTLVVIAMTVAILIGVPLGMFIVQRPTLRAIALGIAGSAVVLRFGPASEWLIWPIPAVLSPFAGVFYPVSTLPNWMRYPRNAPPVALVLFPEKENGVSTQKDEGMQMDG